MFRIPTLFDSADRQHPPVIRTAACSLALLFSIPTQFLDAQTVPPALSVDGPIETRAGGFAFPDGTVQTTAASTAPGDRIGQSANQGLYDNRIVEMAPPLAYVEICFKDGDFDFDIHTNGGDGTSGGACAPGDIGWLIERDERVADTWSEARAECLMDGMRLPEPFEYQFSCVREALLALVNMTVNVEWTGNTALVGHDNNGPALVAPAMGADGCDQGSFGRIAQTPPSGSAVGAYRCAR